MTDAPPDQADRRPVVLIANRGEIAARVIAACHRIGAEAVLAVSAADASSPNARRADRTIVIGPAAASQSYLNPEFIAQAAVNAGADVVHPGYGFLSEQPKLPRLLAEEGIGWAGPSPETLEAVGDKASARAIARKAGVPVGAGADIDDLDDVGTLAETVGYPLLIKAVHGGGGRGIKHVSDADELQRLAPIAAAEALAAFGRDELYLERYYGAARHVEVQVFGDGLGGCQVFGDRDCSVQRRHQKLIEECPAPGLTVERRARLHAAAAALVRELHYAGAGTVEFLVDTESDDIVFLEMNARIQVEHPVTEEAYGIDLVAAQLLFALGRPTGLPDVPPVPPVAVIECRINAEDPFRDFQPVAATFGTISWPTGPGIRVETQIEPGYSFPPFYDSLMAKLIVRAHDRDAAVAGLRAAVTSTVIGVDVSTLPVAEFVLGHPDFQAGGVTTTWFGPRWDEFVAERVA